MAFKEPHITAEMATNDTKMGETVTEIGKSANTIVKYRDSDTACSRSVRETTGFEIQTRGIIIRASMAYLRNSTEYGRVRTFFNNLHRPTQSTGFFFNFRK